jgi:vacuolar-type H+-ATPase subunit C/Vma6
MAEGERLDSLCRIRSLPEFIRTIFPQTELTGVLDFQRLLLYELIDELSGLGAHMTGSGADFTDWMLFRFQAENLKMLIRAFLTKTPIEELYGLFAPLSGKLALDIKGLAAAQSLEDFIRLVPKGPFRDNLGKALEMYRDNPRPFFFEAMLDRGYFQELLTRMERFPRGEREIIRPMVYQEVDIYHLMLVVRGKFYYSISPEMLQPLHAGPTRISHAIFVAMLNDPDLMTAVGRVPQCVLDGAHLEQGPKDRSMDVDASALEGLAWKRFLHLANLAFRQSHMGVGAIVGYTGLRRMEVANLITISEGLHGGMSAENIRGRLIPRRDLERTYV